MKCNTILKELSAQLFAVLLVTLCLSILNVNKAKAIDCEEYFSFLEEHASEVTNTSLKTSIDSLIYQYKNSETVKSVIEANWLDNNVVGVNFPNYSANTWMRVTFNFYNFEEGTKVYKDGNYAFYPPRSNTGDKNFYINYAANGNVDTYGYQNNNSYYTDLFSSNTKMTWVTDSYPVYTSSTSDTIATYYFSDILTYGPKFTKSVHDVVFYENTTVSLGTLQGDYEKSKLQFLLYDVTDPNNLYPPLIAKYGNGISVLGSRVDLESRLVQVGHQYDLYFLYEGETTEQFRYVWRNFMNESGEVIGGYNIQTGVNQLIDYQTSGNQQIISIIESGNKAIINAVNNANNKYWGNSGDLNGIEQEQQIQQMINNITNTMSGELHNNEVFQILETAENGFFDYFRTQHEEQYYDLIIKWPNIKTGLTIGENNQSVDKLLISGDQINISAMCRNIPALQTTRDYLRIIINFMITISIIKQIYNLILGTLGIDNTYLYEDPGLEVEHFEDLNTGQSYNIYRGVGVSGNRYTLRRDTTNIPPKRRIGF